MVETCVRSATLTHDFRNAPRDLKPNLSGTMRFQVIRHLITAARKVLLPVPGDRKRPFMTSIGESYQWFYPQNRWMVPRIVVGYPRSAAGHADGNHVPGGLCCCLFYWCGEAEPGCVKRAMRSTFVHTMRNKHGADGSSAIRPPRLLGKKMIDSLSPEHGFESVLSLSVVPRRRTADS